MSDKAWHRQADETDRAYRAFTTYLNQPSPRTMAFMLKATTHSMTSLLKWSKVHKWVARATAYDNERADQIMQKDVSILTRYQQQITDAGIEDMQMLREAWRHAASRMDLTSLPPMEALDAIQQLTESRLKIEQFSRVTAKMPDKYKPEVVATNKDDEPQQYYQLTLAGPVVMDLTDGEQGEQEGSASEQLTGEVVPAASETSRD